jgi:hypothetical protein
MLAGFSQWRQRKDTFVDASAHLERREKPESASWEENECTGENLLALKKTPPGQLPVLPGVPD